MSKNNIDPNSPQEIRKQLLRIARETKRPSQEVLQHYAMERFLFRLSKSKYSKQFILKGGLLICTWSIGEFRPTQDIDFLSLMNSSPEELEQIYTEICSQSCSDGILFDPDTISVSITQQQNHYRGIELKFKGKIDRSKIHMRIDIGFSDVVHPSPILFAFPAILDMPQAHILGYTPESVIAEKVDAMFRLGEINSRMKDFYDIWYLSHQTPFKLEVLSRALHSTFLRRNTKLTTQLVIFQTDFKKNELKSSQWNNFCTQNKFLDTPTFESLIRDLQVFLKPVLEYLNTQNSSEKSWLPKTYTWKNAS